jgi:predicted dehydrogenase
MSKEIRIGFIGAGGIVGRHVDAFQSVPDTLISGYYSPSQPERPDAWGRILPDVEAVMAESDAVYVCVPPSHHGVEVQLLNARKPFLVEKPLSLSRPFPHAVRKLVTSADHIAAGSYQWRASPISTEAKKAVAETEVIDVTLRYLDPALSYVKDWFLKRGESGGPVVEQATHVLDQARNLLGEFTVLTAKESFAIPEVFLQSRPNLAQADIPTEISAELRFAGDVPGHFEASAVHTGERRVEIEMLCADGSVLTVARDRIMRDDHSLLEVEDFTRVSTVEQNRAFAEAVREQNPTVLYSRYQDAERTHRKVMDIVELARKSSTVAA